MKNRDMPAKPCQEFNQGHCNSELYSGLTKLEYAAIYIHAANLGRNKYSSVDDAIDEANMLFDELEKQS